MEIRVEGWPGSGLFQQGHALGIDKSGAAGYTVQVNTAGDTEENPRVARILTPPIKVTWVRRVTAVVIPVHRLFIRFIIEYIQQRCFQEAQNIVRFG